MTSFWFVSLQLADRIFILPEGVFSAQLFNSYRTTRLTRGFGRQKGSRGSAAASFFGIFVRLRLQQQDACVRAGMEGFVVPKAHLHLTDVGGTDHQHTKTALADAAAHRQGQLAGEQHLMEGQLSAVVAAGDCKLTVKGLGADTDAHGGDLKGVAEHIVPEQQVAVELPIVIVGGAAVVLGAGV